jgi:hypothetical protein
MMPATAVTPEEAKTPAAAAAHEICGDSQKILKMAKTLSTFTQFKLNMIPLILSRSGLVISPLNIAK